MEQEAAVILDNIARLRNELAHVQADHQAALKDVMKRYMEHALTAFDQDDCCVVQAPETNLAALGRLVDREQEASRALDNMQRMVHSKFGDMFRR
jgi:hypothetical protein